MWFKNSLIYRFPVETGLTAMVLQEQFALKPLQACTGLDKQRRGWVSCRGDDRLIHVTEQQVLFALGVEQKLLPVSIINRFAKERAADIEAQQGYKMGRKALKELKEMVEEELLPKAFALQRTTYAWLDLARGWLIIDAASPSRAEEVLDVLSKTIPNVPFKLAHTQVSPVLAMTNWLLSEQTPTGFTIDRELELRSTEDSRATVRYANHALEGGEIQGHIAAGKQATRLGLTWQDKVSFVLTETLHIKKIVFLDILKEQASSMSDNVDELFELDFALMVGELAQMITDLVGALGGEEAHAV